MLQALIPFLSFTPNPFFFLNLQCGTFVCRFSMSQYTVCMHASTLSRLFRPTILCSAEDLSRQLSRRDRWQLTDRRWKPQRRQMFEQEGQSSDNLSQPYARCMQQYIVCKGTRSKKKYAIRDAALVVVAAPPFSSGKRINWRWLM